MRRPLASFLGLCLSAALGPAVLSALPVPTDPGLRAWIDDYVRAYGGRIAVGGERLDASGLLDEVTAHPDQYVERKTVQGTETQFLVVDGVPLALQDAGPWRAVLARDLAEARNARFALPAVWHQTWNPDFARVMKNANLLTVTHDLDNAVVFEKMTLADWRKVLRDWKTIQEQLDSGQIPPGLPYSWTYTDQWSGMNRIIQFAQDNQMGLRAQHLVWNGDGLVETLSRGGFSKAELLKILEFTISVKLIRYAGVIGEWNAADELIQSQFSQDRWGFWQKNVGLWEATRLSARLIRKLAPDAQITIADDHELEERFYNQQPGLGQRFLEFVRTLKKEGLVDKVDFENNLWIYDLPARDHMEKVLRQVQAEGIGLSAPEITVFTTQGYPLWGPETRRKYAKVDDPVKAQAEGYRRAVEAYLQVGAYDLGLGDVGDATSFANFLQAGSSPALFDAQWKPRMGWYEILKALYAGLVK